MKKTVITILSIAAFLGGFLIFYQNRPAWQNTPVANQADQQTNNSQKWATKTDDQASVTVAVTPLDLSPNSAEWKFDVVMDTHSVELDQDLIEASLLVDGVGNEFKPIRWDGPIGGHHRAGVLIFGVINPLPSYVELKIKNVGGVPERSFRWNLE